GGTVRSLRSAAKRWEPPSFASAATATFASQRPAMASRIAARHPQPLIRKLASLRRGGRTAQSLPSLRGIPKTLNSRETGVAPLREGGARFGRIALQREVAIRWQRLPGSTIV